MTKAPFTIQSAQASTKREETGDTVSKWAEEWCSGGQCKKKKQSEWYNPHRYLFVHDVWQLPGQVPVVGLHLVMVLLLVLLDQPLVHSQPLTAGVHELPDEGCDRVFSATSERHAEDRVWKCNMAGHIFCRPLPKCRNKPRKWADRVLRMQTLPSLITWTPLWAVWPCCQDISWHCCRPGRLWRRREGRHWPGKQRGWKIRNDWLNDLQPF